MKSNGHTAVQINSTLKAAKELIAQVKTVADVCLVIEVTPSEFRRNGSDLLPAGTRRLFSYRVICKAVRWEA